MPYLPIGLAAFHCGQLLLGSVVAESAWTDETFLSFRVRRRRSSSNSSRERAPWQEPAAGSSARRGVGRGEEEDALVHDEGLRARAAAHAEEQPAGSLASAWRAAAAS